MRRFVYTGFWLTVFGTIALFFLSRYEKIERLEMRVTGNIQTDHIDHIWFSPTGELVGAGRKETQLIVRVWSCSNALVRERAVSLPADREAKPVFAVSGDASQAGWRDLAAVGVANLTAPKQESAAILKTGRSAPISSLAFTGPGKLAALYRDGGLERDLANLSLPANTKRKNYALVPMTGEGWQAAAERLREHYAIEPLTYSPSTAQHPEVVEFLNKLDELVRQKTATQEYFQAAE